MTAAELYQQAIKSLAQSATGHGRLEAPDGAALADNPLCGDRVEMEVKLGDGRVAEVAHRVKGCLLCRAAASAIGMRVTGARLDEIERVAAQLSEMLGRQAPPPQGWSELAAFAPVHGHRSRYGCVLLPFDALVAAMKQAGSPKA
jgi:nitrogen fixation protein NifU and related proteins